MVRYQIYDSEVKKIEKDIGTGKQVKVELRDKETLHHTKFDVIISRTPLDNGEPLEIVHGSGVISEPGKLYVKIIMEIR